MKNLTMISLLMVALATTVVPAFAKDRHYGQDKHRDGDSDRQHDKNFSGGKQYHQPDKHRRYYSGQKFSRNDDKHYKRHHEHKRYSSGRKYSSKPKYHYRHHNDYSPRYYAHPRYYYRSNSYVEDYYTILGGTILINELLHHSHDYH